MKESVCSFAGLRCVCLGTDGFGLQEGLPDPGYLLGICPENRGIGVGTLRWFDAEILHFPHN